MTEFEINAILDRFGDDLRLFFDLIGVEIPDVIMEYEHEILDEWELVSEYLGFDSEEEDEDDDDNHYDWDNH